jgi:hypothetical protein
MKLIEVVEKLATFGDELTMFIESCDVLTADTKVLIVDLDDESDSIDGFREFLDVWHAIETVKGKASLAGVENPTASEKVELLIQYAENNA